MSWSEIKKVVNSDFTTPLNTRIDSQTSTLANKFGLTFESTNKYSIAATSDPTTWTPSKDGIILATYASSSNGSADIGLSKSGKLVETEILKLWYNSGGKHLTGIAVVKGGTTLYMSGNFQLTYYSLGGAFRKCFENLIANILLKKGGVLA